MAWSQADHSVSSSEQIVLAICRFRTDSPVSQTAPAGCREESHMKYILLIYGEERVWADMSQEQMAEIYASHRRYGEEMGKAGVMKGGSELKPASTATSIR